MRTKPIAVLMLSATLAGTTGTRSAAAEPLPDAASPQVAAVGDVVGSVTLANVDDPTPPMLSPYARRRYAPPSAPLSTASPDNVVVYVVVEGTSAAATAARARIVQRDRTIMPHVTIVQAGTRIDFPNEDEVFHNLFSLSDARPFNFGRYAPGETRAETFDRAGIVRMFCDIHSEMSATIVVVDTPFYAKPNTDGEFRITGVPEGRHTLVAWHESAGMTTQEIEVRGGGATRADLRIAG